MALHTNVSVPAFTWTQLTNADATSITFQNIGAAQIAIMVTVGAVTPVNANGALYYQSKQGEINTALTDLAPGLAGTRVYAYAETDVTVSVSHA